MVRSRASLLVLALSVAAANPLILRAAQGLPLGSQLADFTLPDAAGRTHQLSDWQEPLVAVIFVSTECPLAKLYTTRLNELARQYEGRLRLVSIDSNRRDTPEEVREWIARHKLKMLVLCDQDQAVADQFHATRNPEVFLLDRQRKLRYHGRIDDQYTVLVKNSHPRRHDLVEAAEELLSGKPVSVPQTEATGCVIDRSAANDAGDVTWYRDVLPIVRKLCVACHRQGQSGPFELVTYEDAQSWRETIGEVIRDGRMPPWYANPKYGEFANDASLTDDERQLLLAWVDHGGPPGDPSQTPADLPSLPTAKWHIDPDVILELPESFTVPAAGIVEYQYFTIDPGFQEDTWVRAAEVRPTNPAVVHHCIVQMCAPDSDGPTPHGTLQSFYLINTTPGRAPLDFPPGMAKRIPAGWKLQFVMHYQSIGSPQVDRTQLGLDLVDAATVRKEVATRGMVPNELDIPAGASHFKFEMEEVFPADLLLFSLTPHMHLRGRSFRYTACYPDGRQEILLDIPRWNFDWQERFVLAKPKRLPAGTRMVATAMYDNSAANPANPDPTADVHYGPDSTDEMFNAWYEVALADEDLAQPPSLFLQIHQRGLELPLLLVAGLLGALLWVRRRRAAPAAPSSR